MRRKKTSATLSQGFIFTGEQAEEVGDSGEKASRHSGETRANTGGGGGGGGGGGEKRKK